MGLFNKSHKMHEWVKVKEYEIYVHKIIRQLVKIKEKQYRIIFIEVEYRNNTLKTDLSCRKNQWFLYAEDGYSYEAISDFTSEMELGGNVYDPDEMAFLGVERYINPGRNVRGWLAFRIPENKTVKYVQFISSVLDTKTADIELINEIYSELESKQ